VRAIPERRDLCFTARMHNRQFKLKARPQGMVDASHFDFVTAEAPTPGAGEVLVRVHYLSIDPAMRGWMNEGKSYVPPVALGEVMRALGVGRVAASNDPDFSVGDWVSGALGVQDYALRPGKELVRINSKLAPLPRFLSALGMTGMTAYFGLLEIGQPKAGETVVVSAAAGAVGALVGQMAKIKGCRVIGIAGGADKCRYLVDELGFDGVVDYKHDDVRARLKELCPRGIDVYFDNVGGEILDIALALLAKRARIVICGAISQYNNASGMVGPKNYMMLLVCRARMEGFVVFDYQSRYLEAAQQIASWLAEGKLKAKEDIDKGLENFPAALLKLYKGENFGKLILEVAPE
jgi:NADPH-dependent curcumin reductase CurA